MPATLSLADERHARTSESLGQCVLSFAIASNCSITSRSSFRAILRSKSTLEVLSPTPNDCTAIRVPSSSLCVTVKLLPPPSGHPHHADDRLGPDDEHEENRRDEPLELSVSILHRPASRRSLARDPFVPPPPSPPGDAPRFRRACVRRRSCCGNADIAPRDSLFLLYSSLRRYRSLSSRSRIGTVPRITGNARRSSKYSRVPSIHHSSSALILSLDSFIRSPRARPRRRARADARPRSQP